jgi:hypothetical protein
MDGPGLPGRSLYEAACFERQDHLMHGGRRDPKVLLHIGLRRRAPVDLAVVINKSRILTLFVRVSFRQGQRSNKSEFVVAWTSPFSPTFPLIVPEDDDEQDVPRGIA